MNPEQETDKLIQQQMHHSGAHNPTDESQLGFLRKLLYRRVPQAVGFYLAGSWTFLEFFESLISRHNISPHWQDVSLLVIVLLFPSMLILAYRHGAPGIQPWTNVEKVGIPSNLLITLLIIFSQFLNKDLGTSAEIIKGVGPDGTIIELERPKAEFSKRLAISFFDITDVNSDEYLALGLPLAIQHDLEQDPYLNIFDPSALSYEIKQSDFRGLKVPLALMLKIAKNHRIEYLVTGNLSRVGERLVLKANLYRVEKGTLIKKLVTTDHADIFTAVDDLSVQIKSAMGFSGGHINHSTDLPIAEQLTNSMPAFLAFVKSQHEESFKDDFTTTEAELQKAIDLDDSFSIASAQYALLLFRQSRTEEGLKLLQLAKKHNYRLTDSLKFTLAAIGSLYSANPTSARNIVKQWIELYPDDADAWHVKSMLHINFGERLLAIEAIREVIKLEPFGTHRYLTIGKIYTSIGDIESALQEYEKFTTKNPGNARGHLLTGDSNRALGHFQIAKEEYQQAKLLLTNDLTADRRLADLVLRQGSFQNAEEAINSYLNSCVIPEDEYLAWQEFADFYWLRGQRKESLSAFRNSFEALKKFSPETSYLLMRVKESWRFAAAGIPEEGQQMIDDADIVLGASKSELYEFNLKISQALFDAHTGKTDNAIRLVSEVSQTISNYVGSGTDDTMAMLMGIIQYKSGDYSESSSSLEKFLQQNPVDQTEIMALMGESLYRNGQINSAKETFEQILKEFPSHPLANFGIARVEIELEKPEIAKPYLEKALKGWEPADSTFEPAIQARKLSAQLKSI